MKKKNRNILIVASLISLGLIGIGVFYLYKFNQELSDLDIDFDLPADVFEHNGRA